MASGPMGFNLSAIGYMVGLLVAGVEDDWDVIYIYIYTKFNRNYMGEIKCFLISR